jgi:serine/threonine protein kinase
MSSINPDSFYFEFMKSIQTKSAWYQNLQFLGKGGNGVTLFTLCTAGEHRGEHFALKIFYKISSDRRRERFLEEVKFLKKQSHHSILGHVDDGFLYPEYNNYPFVVTSYLPYTLADELKKGPLDTGRALIYTTQLLSALKYLQNRCILHRDIKPQNIFINGPVAILGDFGLIKDLSKTTVGDDDREFMKESTFLFPDEDLRGYIAMPKFYRTPELVAYAKGTGELSLKSDIFQLGLVVAEMFTGKNPLKFSKDPYSDIEINPLGNIPGVFGRGIAGLIKKMLCIDTEKRADLKVLQDGFIGVFQDYAAKKYEFNGKVIDF